MMNAYACERYGNERNRPVRRTAKLDMYDYDIKHKMDEISCILIRVSSNTDIRIADISGEVTSCDGLIYVEGQRFEMLTMETVNLRGQWFLRIYVKKL